MKLLKKTKNEKGAITLFVVLSIMFFTLVLVGLYINTSYKMQKQEKDIEDVQKSYNNIDVDELYNKVSISEGNPNEDYEIIRMNNGNWNPLKKVNSPKTEDTGLIPIYYDDEDEVVELTEESTDAEWEKWYDYSKREWANAITKDEDDNITGYFVWIPRYAYKIKSELGNGGNLSGTIDVVFIDIDNKNRSDQYSETYPTVTGDAMDDFVVHPAFTDDIDNGGWDEDIPGFWVAKYAAGFQNGTIGETAGTIKYSPTLKYTTVNNSYTSNFLESSIVVNSTSLSYPVFKANTYAYNLISASDSFVLSKEIKDASSMYGLSNIDSHMEKNSEWGAVAYLTQSSYGINSTSTNPQEVTINSKNLDNAIYVNNVNNGTLGNVYAVTSYGDNNTVNNVSASSTQNITGVFDLNGCVWERIAGFRMGGNASNPLNHSLMATEDTNQNSKYLTLYSTSYASCDKYGDAIQETSISGSYSNSWNLDASGYVSLNSPVLRRGGYFSDGSSAGIFAFDGASAGPGNTNGFRIILIPD